MAKPFIPDRDRSSSSSRLAGDVGARVPGLRAREVRDELAPLNFFETAYAPNSLQVSVRLNSAREQGQNSAIWARYSVTAADTAAVRISVMSRPSKNANGISVFDSKT